MSGIVVAGLGNRLRQDDGVGPVILDRLATLDLPDAVSLLWLEHDPRALSLLDPELRSVIIVDAVVADMGPGSIISLPLLELEHPAPLNLHQLSPLELLPDKLLSRTEVLGIVPYSLAYGVELSPVVAKAAQRAVDYLLHWTWEACHL